MGRATHSLLLREYQNFRSANGFHFRLCAGGLKCGVRSWCYEQVNKALVVWLLRQLVNPVA
jgi:hypothetical protein